MEDIKKRSEHIVICAMLKEPSYIHHIMSMVSKDMISSQDNSIIFSQMVDVYMNNEPINLISIYQAISRKDFAIKKIVLAHLSSIYSMFTGVSRDELDTAITFLISESVRNDHISLGSDILNMANSDAYHPKEVISKIQDHIVSNKYKAILNKKELNNQQLMEELDRKMLEAAGKNGVSGIKTGYDRFDVITSGMQPTNLIIVAARPAMGKELVNSSRVYTPGGYMAIGDIKEGETVLGSNGKPCKVTGVFPQGLKDVYRIRFDDGTHVDCGLEHQWEVSTIKTRARKLDPVVLTTAQMIGNVRTVANKRNYSIRFCEPLNFNESELTLHPYLLGALIGDGSFQKGSVIFSNSETDIIEKVTNHLPDDCTIKHKKAFDYRITGINKYIRDLGLMHKRSHEKFIPREYLYNSVSNRVQLLMGLIDTDGYVMKQGSTGIEYSTTSKMLCDDILELVRGLGGKASYRKLQGRYKKNGQTFICKDFYRMYISMPKEILPLSSEKHLRKYSTNKKYHSKAIVSIEKMDYKQEMTCISVDAPDCLYVTDGCTLTHNTQFALGIIRSASIKDNKKGLFISCEMDEVQVMKRIVSVDSGIPGSNIKFGRLDQSNMLRYEKSKRRIADSNFKIVAGSFTISDVLSLVYKMKNSEGLDYVIIDYIQKITSPGAQNRTNEVGDVSRKLKDMANELKIPVIALAQLSRAVEHRTDKKPVLSDLRESGDIEQDADIVTFLYRPSYYMAPEERDSNPMSEDGYVVIAKHRDGELEDIYLKFKSEIPAWVNPRGEEYDDEYFQSSIQPNDDFDYQGSQPF